MQNIINIEVEVDNLQKIIADNSSKVVANISPMLSYIIPGKLEIYSSIDGVKVSEAKIHGNMFTLDRQNSGYQFKLRFYIYVDNVLKSAYVSMIRDNAEITILDFIYGAMTIVDIEYENKFMYCKFVKENKII